jgi:hypothetical protein
VVSRGGTAPAPTLTDAQLATLIGMAARPTTSGAVVHHGGAGGRAGHPGITITYPTPDYVPPANVSPLEAAPETRTWTPLALIVSAAAFLGGPLAELVGNSLPAAVVLCLAGFAGGVRSLVLILRRG